MDNSTQFSVLATKGGPYVISGYFKLNLPTGEIKECNGKTYLCRCGSSKNKPFCDESHNNCNLDISNSWF